MAKILHISQRYAPAYGGAESYVKTVAEWNVKEGHEVDVWTTDALEADALWYPKRMAFAKPSCCTLLPIPSATRWANSNSFAT